jgi:hypothetical protein
MARVPDGLLWTVVLMCGAQTFSRTRFVERIDADEYAHKLIREQHGCRVHIEGPELPTPAAKRGDFDERERPRVSGTKTGAGATRRRPKGV